MSSPIAPMIAPSILSADFANLAAEAAAVSGPGSSRADWLHVDVMDAHFVPNLTLGLPIVESLLKATDIPLDCHLMIEDPGRWAPPYAEAGAYNIDEELVTVDGPLRMSAADGYSMVARDVSINLEDRRMVGAGGVEGAVPAGTFSANRIEADLAERTVTLIGDARLQMRPGELRMP